MIDYKQLNRELIDANRELKQLIATLQKELVLMRAELMEQHRIRVEAEYNCRERLLSTLVNNFITSIKEVDADVNIMELLGYNDCVQNVNSASVGMTECSSSTRSNRRSTQLVRDFRRTSAVCRRQSVVQMSPTRRVHVDDAAIEEEENKEYASDAQSGSDMDLDNSINSDIVIDVENDDTGENIELDCINEASDEECGGEEVHNSARKQQPLRDLSNQMTENKTNKENIITKRGKTRERVSENSIEMARDVDPDFTQPQTQYVADMEVEDDLVTSMRRSLHVSRSTSDLYESARRIDAQNIENLVCKEKSNRHLVVRLHRLHEPPHIEVHNAIEEDTIIQQEIENITDMTRKNDEKSLALTEFSMDNFLDAPCSTPCISFAAKTAASAEIAAIANRCEEIGSTTFFNSALSENCQNTRPSRKCTPRTLAEPSLREKLRSDSGKRRPKSRKR